MKAIVILADSVNRRYLDIYNKDAETIMPNLKRLEEKSVVFDSHWTASAPCMPARRDLFTGRVNFLERNWGPIEPFDQTMPQILKENGIFTHMVTDHYHYLEIGGENYCQSFNTWECFRGQEKDPWKSRVNNTSSKEHLGRYVPQYELNKRTFVEEADYTTPKTFKAAADWLEDNADQDNFLLWVEGFDPHEPFDMPETYLELYEDDYDGPAYNWPEYAPVNTDDKALEHIRNRYKASLTMMDKWMGKLLDVMDERDLWDDTMIIFTTDHGYMLGEHGLMAKNYMPAYNEVFHIPMLIHYPGIEQNERRVDALTQNIDLFSTLIEYFGIDDHSLKNRIHGKSLIPIIKKDVQKIRDYNLYGYYGKSMNITDGKHTLFKASSNKNNMPLFLYTAMPTTICQYYGLDNLSDLKKIEMGRYLDWTDYPVFKIPANIIEFSNESQRFDRRSEYNDKDLMFDITDDYGQEIPIEDDEVKQRLMNEMVRCLIHHGAPKEQLTRLGLSLS